MLPSTICRSRLKPRHNFYPLTPHPPRGRRSRLELAPQPGAARRSAPTSSRPDSRPADSPSLSGTQRAPSPWHRAERGRGEDRWLGRRPTRRSLLLRGEGAGAVRIATARGRERWGRGVRCSASQLPPPRCNHIRRCNRYTRRAARRPPAHRRSASQQAEGATASHSAPRLRRAPPEARCTRRRPCSPARSTHPNSSSPLGLPSPTPTITTATHPTLAGARPQTRLASRVRSRGSSAPTQ